MADQTVNYGIPKPTSSDPPDVPSDMGAMADAIDVLLLNLHTAVDGHVFGDGSPGTVTSGTAIRCTQSAQTYLATATFTLAAQQQVGFSAATVFIADSTSGSVGAAALAVEIDGSVPGNGWGGPVNIGVPNSDAERVQCVVPYFTKLLNSGSHTVKLRAERDGNGVINALRNSSLASGGNPNPTLLNIVV